MHPEWGEAAKRCRLECRVGRRSRRTTRMKGLIPPRCTVLVPLIVSVASDARAPCNAEVRGASRLAGEASSREAATSTAGLEGGGK